MCSTLVLAMPNFLNTFVIESNACGVGIDVVLMQEGRPLAFTSKALSGMNLVKSTYEKNVSYHSCCSTVENVPHWSTCYYPH